MGKPFFNFRYQCYTPNYPDKIEALLHLARPERWDYLRDQQDVNHKILVNYIDHTYNRLNSLNRKYPNGNYLFSNEKNACFNTGLFTTNFEPIFALLERNDPAYKVKWKLRGFYKESSRELRSISPLPERAHYFDKVEDLIYDTKHELRVNIDHILEDERNRQRIPEIYRDSPNLAMLFKGAALDFAKIRIMENYKAAVPQYFNGKIQFLIPISLGDPSVVDLSLAVGLEDGIYTGHTCLTLDMAYNNARLIAKPESDWLVSNPEAIHIRT